MSLYSDPPPLHSFQEDKPALLVCWWTTIFCTVIILLRVGGRFVRTERLFREDRTAALALIPLYLRMGCVHLILLYGTNNAQLAGADLTPEALYHKQIASGLVLLSRILYAATLWILKNAILEFFKRLNVSWSRSYSLTLLAIRCTLVATFVAIVISDLAECQPFAHYWQVLPDPGGQCRQGYAQLLTMAACNVLTDLLLVFFPIPIILSSQMSFKRKIQLVLLFSLSLGVVATTLYRVPHIIQANGSQQLRSLYASVELLFATAAANALVLGSFVRDRGLKKRKFKYGSVAAGRMESHSDSASRRPTVNRHWGSDEDLVRGVAFSLKRDLQDRPDAGHSSFTPAPLATMPNGMHAWQFPLGQKRPSAYSDEHWLITSSDRSPPPPFGSPATHGRKVSFFDVGGLLDVPGASGSAQRQDSLVPPPSGGDPSTSPNTSLPSPSLPAGASGFRRGSTALLQDIGGIISPLAPKPPRTRSRAATEMQPIPGPQQGDRKPSHAGSPYPDHPGMPELVLNDPGGLLS